MKKRIGSKFYDTERGIPVLPEQNLYKQPSKKTFYLFDGEKITPVSNDEAYNMVRGAGKNELLSMFENKANNRGCVTVTITLDRYYKLQQYARENNTSVKSVIEMFVDSLEM